MWKALQFEFHTLRFPPFPFSYANSGLHYDYSLNCKLLYWHIYLKIIVPLVVLFCSGLLLKEIINPSTPTLTVVKVLGLLVQIILGIQAFEFALEFPTNGRGLLEIFNEINKIHDKISCKIHRLMCNSQRHIHIKCLRKQLNNVVSFLKTENSQVDTEGLVALATAGLLFASIPFLFMFLQFEIDFAFFFINLIFPLQYTLSYKMSFLILRFFIILQIIIETMRLISFKILLSEFVIHLMASNLKILFSQVQSLNNFQLYLRVRSGMRVCSQMALMVSNCDLTFGNQLTTITSVNSAILIMIGFVVITLNHIVPGYATVCLFLYTCVVTQVYNVFLGMQIKSTHFQNNL